MNQDKPWSDSELARLQALLDSVPAPLEPLDLSAIDGYLCGVLLQPTRVAASRWLPGVADVEGRPLPRGFDATELHALVQRRHAELDQAISQRQWFDPWIYALDDEASASESVLPWVAGFAAAQDLCPALMAIEDPELIEPLALLYLHFEPEDLEDADALQAVIETLEPPKDLAEAVQDMVRAVMLIADVSVPRALPKTQPKPSRPKRSPSR